MSIFRNSQFLTHVNILLSDAPNDSMYMMSGMLIAMLLVAVIIVLLAVTIRSLKLVQRLQWHIFRPIWFCECACMYPTTLHFQTGTAPRLIRWFSRPRACRDNHSHGMTFAQSVAARKNGDKMPRTVFVMLTEGSERKGANARYAFLEHVRKKSTGLELKF